MPDAPQPWRRCPVCGHTDVREISPRGRLMLDVGRTPSVTETGLVVRVFACQTCGFLMLHRREA